VLPSLHWHYPHAACFIILLMLHNSSSGMPTEPCTTHAAACRRLASLHALGSSKAAGGLAQQRQQQQQPKKQQQSAEQAWAGLSQQQRLHAMAPHGRAPASFLAAAGPVAGEVTQAVQVRALLCCCCHAWDACFASQLRVFVS
jgi:hypothetical protein